MRLFKLAALPLFFQLSVAAFPAQATEINHQQETSFKFLYYDYQQEGLLAEAEEMTNELFSSLQCANPSVSSRITQEMYEASFLEKLAGGKSEAARFELTASAQCPSSIENFQMYVSFSFHTSEMRSVIYFAYQDTRTNQIASGVYLEPFSGQREVRSSFPGPELECQEAWAQDDAYSLLANQFCR